MTSEEIKLRRLNGQHLLRPAPPLTVAKDLCGLQAQFLGHALWALALRSGSNDTRGLVKSWTNRGTMHLFAQEDLPLFLHEGRSCFLRPVDTLTSDAYVDADRKALFADLILQAVAGGTDDREALKLLCQEAGMTEDESRSLFDPWGGLIRGLCESGRLCHKVQEKKAYRLCPAFTPMEELPARRELLRRYFTYYGPATVKDAAYFFGTTQGRIRAWMQPLPLEETTLEGRSYYYFNTDCPQVDLPSCLFLAGFDALLLGYEKTESPFLPPALRPEIFTRAGIVRPALLIHGTVQGWWNLKNRKLKLMCLPPALETLAAEAAGRLWPDLKAIEFVR